MLIELSTQPGTEIDNERIWRLCKYVILLVMIISVSYGMCNLLSWSILEEKGQAPSVSFRRKKAAMKFE